jgi:signal transduction histidine kinase
MRLMSGRRRLSIGARLTLSSAGVMLLTIGVIALVVLLSIERKINQDSLLILRAYAFEVLDEIAEDPKVIDAPAVASVAASTLARLTNLDPSFEPTFALFDPQGKPLIANGILAQHSVPIPPMLLGGEEQEVLSTVDLGLPFHYLVAAVPAPNGFLEVAIRAKRFDREIDRIRRVFVLTTPLMLLFTGAGGWWISRRSLRPIVEITATARRISGDELDAQIPIAGTNDELDQLAVTLNDMIARIRSSMEKLRRVSADAAHQLKSPLSSLRNRLEITLETGVASAAHRADLEAVLSGVIDLSDGVGAMLQLARTEAGLEPGQARLVDVAQILDAVVTLYAPVAEERRIHVQHASGGPSMVFGDPSWLSQLLGNLIDNAIRYTEPGGSVQIWLVSEGNEVVVRVADTGQGIAPDEIEHVFERFHRGGRGRESSGFGLGLAVAREIAQEHGGRIAVQSRVGAGSVFAVYLPAGEKPNPLA